MLKGQISIIGIENLSYGKRFESLFTCSWDLIDCALMSIGNYAQQERNKWRHQVGSNSMQYAWDELFQHMHPCNIAWDRIHPNQTGCMYIAKQFLAAVGFDR